MRKLSFVVTLITIASLLATVFVGPVGAPTVAQAVSKSAVGASSAAKAAGPFTADGIDLGPVLQDPWWPAWLAFHDPDGNLVQDRVEVLARESVESVGRGESPLVPLLISYGRVVTEVDARAIEQTLGATVVHTFRWIPTILAAVPAAAVSEAGALPGVVAVEWDAPLEPLLTASAAATQSREATGSPYNGETAEALGYKGQGAVIAVLDTGVADKDPVFAGKWIAGAESTFQKNRVGAVSPAIGPLACVNPEDDESHGTHVAATALGNAPGDNHKGTAMDARLVEIKIAAAGASGVSGTIGVPFSLGGGDELGFEWVLDWNAAIDAGAPLCGAGLNDRIDVATLSFGTQGAGGPNAGTTEAIVTQLTQNGVVVTIAAGNVGGSEFTIASPGNAAGALSIANSDDKNTISRVGDSLAATSSRGPNQGTAFNLAGLADRYRKPDVAAPGTNIEAAHSKWSQTPAPANAIWVRNIGKTGTSMSTPHVAGIAALLVQAGEDVKAQTGGVNLMRPTGPGFNAANGYIEGQHPVRDALIHSAEYMTAGVSAAMLTKWQGPGADGLTWNNGYGYGHVNAFAALCWAWANILQPGGATPSATVATKCDLASGLTASAGGPYEGLVSEPIALTPDVQGGVPPYAYLWNVTSAPAGGAGLFDDPFGAAPTLTVDTPGTYGITVRVTDSLGAMAIASAQVAADAVPQPLTVTSPAEGAAFDAAPIRFEGAYDTTSETLGASATQTSLSPPDLKSQSGELKVLDEPWIDGLRQELAETKGFLGLRPTGDHALTAYFAGPTAPAQALPDGWSLQQEGDVKLEKALHRFPPGTPRPASRTGPPVPAASTGIGPGAPILIDIPEEGLVGCTANFVWYDASRDTYYLGAAGHCFLPVDRTATHGPGADYNAAGVRTWVCVAACTFGGLSGQLLTSFTVELGGVAYARQGPGHDLIGAGEDFGIVEIPASVYDLVRPEMPVWNGPTGEDPDGFTVGSVTVQFGHGLVWGETFATQARAGLANVPWDFATGPWYAFHPSLHGDSGSAVETGVVSANAEIIEGANAAGILTHIGVPFGLAAGTFVHNAKAMAAQAGLGVRVVLEGEQVGDGGGDPGQLLAAILSPAEGAVIDVSQTPTLDVRGVATFPASAGFDPTTAWLRWDGDDTTCGATSLRLVDGPDGGNGCSKTFGVLGGPLGLVDAFPADFDPVALAPGGPVTGKIYFGAQGPDPGRVRFVLRNGATELGSQTAEFVHVAALGVGGFVEVPVAFELDGLTSDTPLGDLHFDIELQQQGAVQWVNLDNPASFIVLPFAGEAPERSVEISIDDRAFTNPYVANGTTDWTFSRSLAGLHLGPHIVFARARVGNLVQQELLGINITLVGEAALPYRIEARVTDAGGNEALPWTQVQGIDEASTGTWAFDWLPDPLPADGAYTFHARLVGPEGTVGEAARGFLIEHQNLAPNATVVAPQSAGRHENVFFDGGSSRDPDGLIVNYTWYFGDGGQGHGRNATHAYAALGVYNVTLVVTDDEGATATALHRIEIVNAAPFAKIAGPASVKRNKDAAFSGAGSVDPDGGIVAYEWDFGDGSTGTGPNVTHRYKSLGSYTVTLVVRDADGATGLAKHTIAVTRT